MRVVGHDGFDDVVLRAKGGSLATVPVEDLLEEATAARKVAPAADPIRLAKVARYKSVLGPLIAARRRTRADVEAAAAALDLSVASVYRALERFQLTSDFNELPPPTRPGGRGGTRLVPGAEAIIAEAIEKILLTRRQHRVAKFMARPALAGSEGAGGAVRPVRGGMNGSGVDEVSGRPDRAVEPRGRRSATRLAVHAAVHRSCNAGTSPARAQK